MKATASKTKTAKQPKTKSALKPKDLATRKNPKGGMRTMNNLKQMGIG